MTPADRLLQGLEAWPLAEWLRSSLWAYPVVNAAHIVGIALLLGGIAVLDLRLLGFRRHLPLAAVASAAWPVAVAGALLAVLTGPLLFMVKPLEYIANPAFVWKFVLLTLALTNVAAFHVSCPGVLQGRQPPGTAARLCAGFSLLLWLAVLMAGRLIGFM